MLAISSDTGLDILRYVVGLIFVYHGLRSLMKPSAASDWRMSSGVYMLMGAVEVLASAAMFLNIQVFLASILLSVISLNFIYTKVFKVRVPFSGSHATGWQFDLLLLAANLALVFANMPVR